MDAKTIQNLGKLYRLLDEACSDRVNQADLDNATRFPGAQRDDENYAGTQAPQDDPGT